MSFKKTGEITTLIEWDNDVPDWPTLYQEALDAQTLMAEIGANTHAAQ